MNSGKMQAHFWFLKTRQKLIRFWGIKLGEFQLGTWLAKKKLIADKF